LFEDQLVCRGQVEVINNSDNQKKVVQGSTLEGKVVLD